VDVDADHHFVKTCYSGSEVANLQRCAGSPFTVQLLGRSSAGQLVFARHGRDVTRSWPCTVGDVKCLLLLDVRALAALHALGVIHRDLVAPNVLLDDGFLVLCDLEGQLSSVGCRAPELWVEHPHYTPASDVFALGTLMWSVCFHNSPRMLVFYTLFPSRRRSKQFTWLASRTTLRGVHRLKG
jgi:serine/threonine protein kinase